MNNEVTPELKPLTHEELVHKVAQEAQFLYEGGADYNLMQSVSDSLFRLVTAIGAAHASALSAAREKAWEEGADAVNEHYTKMDFAEMRMTEFPKAFPTNPYRKGDKCST